MQKLPAVPLRNLFVVPCLTTSLVIGRKESVEAIKQVSKNDSPKILLIPQVDSEDEIIDSSSQFQTIGTMCEILELVELPDSSFKVQVKGIDVVEVHNLSLEDNCWTASYLTKNYKYSSFIESSALAEVLVEAFGKYSKINTLITPFVVKQVKESDDYLIALHKIASYIKLTTEELFSIYRMVTYEEMATSILEYINSEILRVEIKRNIDSSVRKKIEKTQKKIFIQEQISELNKELNDQQSPSQKYAKQLESITSIEEKYRVKLQNEIQRVETIHNSSPEYTVLTTYLDIVLNLPWGKETAFDIDIKKVSESLDSQHYGLEDVKEKILEHLAIMQYSKKSSSSILCLVGPPGVGKSTLAKSIANAIGKKFVSFSLGGLSDDAELKGHRKTYIGAMPGQIIKKISDSGVVDPVFLLDEIDKLGNGVKGDPSYALLDILDREQNSTFQDNYLDIPFDISKVMFILTANSLSTIPRPLLDRLEIIELSSYLYPEKIEIAKKYIIPKVMDNFSIKDSIVTFKDSSIDSIVRYYTRESGVRQLKREIETIVKKAVKRILTQKDEKQESKIKIEQKNIEEFLGKPKYLSSDLLENDSVGNVVGLAWTSVGGSILFVQATVFKSDSGKFIVTGNLGDVMKESTTIALSVAKKICEKEINEDFYKNHEIHLHIPEGATPKDGPSAGITMATAIVSAILSKKVKKDIAMTGELSLVGKVLPIGGLREKLTSAISSGTKTVLVPIGNTKDVEELPNYIKENIEIKFVSEISQVLENSFV